MHIAAICEREAAALLAATNEAADIIKAGVEASKPHQQEDFSEDMPERTARIDAVKAYFEEHHRRKAAEAAAEADADRHPHPGNTQPAVCCCLTRLVVLHACLSPACLA